MVIMINENDSGDIFPKGFVELLQSSNLSTFIPSANPCDIEKLLHDSIKYLQGQKSPLVFVPQRQVLFFDETLDVYIALKTSRFDEKILNSFLKILIITIEAQVFNSQSENNDAPSAHETIITESIQDTENPQFVIQVPNKSDKIRSGVEYLFVWKSSITIDKMRIRLQSPFIKFSAKSTLRHGKNKDSFLNDQYLQSRIPSSFNILEAFGNDTSLNGVKPLLSASKISRVISDEQKVAKSVCLLKSTSFEPLRIYPAFHVGIKYSKLITVSGNSGVIASLEIMTTPWADFELKIKRVGLNLKDGWVDDLFTKFGISIPVVCLPKESIIFPYFLIPNDIVARPPVQDLEISIFATVNLSNGYRPLIEMCWTSSLSFIPPINPGFGTPTSSIKRSHRPFQLSVDNNAVDSKMIFSDLEAFTPNPLNSRLKPSPSVTDFGVKASITNSSTSTPIYPGIPFTWKAIISNESDRQRKLSLNVLCKPFLFGDSPSQNSSPCNLEQLDLKVANAVVDENLLLKMQRSSCRAAEIICLTTNQEIGLLSPMTCHEVELKFIALDTGIISVDAVRIVDLDKTTYLDIKSLPVIFVSPIPKH